jgi:hypothetical protein
MLRPASLARRSLPAALVLLAAVGLAGACGGLSEGVDPGGSSSGGLDGAANDGAPGSGDDGSATSRDAALDATEIVEAGGGNIDPDAGDTPSLLPDGGACTALANGSKSVVSTCASIAPVLGGGAIVAGTYALVSVVALAPQTFCSNLFVPVGFKQTIRLAVSGNGFAFETVTDIGGTGARYRTGTAAVTAPGKVQLLQTCPVAGAQDGSYASGLVNGKQTLVMRLAYGRGEALYRYELP